MRSKKKGFKKVLAEFLCVALIACSIPGAAFAAEEENTGKGSITADYDTDGQKDTSGTGSKESADTGTDKKDFSGSNEQDKGEENTKDSDGTSGTDGESSEGKDEGSGTETKGSDSGKTESESKDDSDEESADTEQNTSDAEDDESDGESTEDSAENDTEDDAGSDDDTDMDSDDVDDDTDAEDDIDTDTDEVEDEDEAKSGANNETKGGFAAFDDEEDEEEEDEDDEEEDWIDGSLDEDLMLLTASPSDATPVAEMDGEYYDTVQNAIDEAENRSMITMVDDSTENIIISDGLILTLDLAGFTLEGDSEGSVVTIIDAELTLEDSSGDEGRITGGSSDYGGGIHISNGIFRMAGGTISDNTADIYGGGVYLDSGTFTMTGGVICENTADTAGSDIYAEEGSVAILEASDMMDGDYKWYEDDEDSRYSEDNSSRVCDDEEVVGASSPGNVRRLALVASDGITPLADGDVAQIGSTTYATVQAAVNAAGSGDTITMIADSQENVNISGGKNIILDLAGCTLDGGKSGNVIYNNGTLTLTDSIGSGCITNGYAQYGGGIRNYGNFIMEGGVISENTATDRGGGVCNDGTFEMRGGEIKANTADSGGGGVYTANTFTMIDGSISKNSGNFSGGVEVWYGTFTMNGGTISDNTADIYGGGVYNQSEFIMEDGTISGNAASLYGGGVCSLGGVFTMNGGTINVNTAGYTGGGVLNDSTFTMNGGTISGNAASSYGGGVSNYSTFTMKGGAVHKNTSENGADFYTQDGSIALIAASEMSGVSNTDFTYYAWFDEWSSSSDPSEYTGEGISSEPVSVGDLALTAAEKGTLTYYVDGEAKATESHKTDVTVTVKSGNDFDISSPHFIGWSTNEGSSTAEYAPGDSYTVSVGNTDLYDAYSEHDYVGVVTKEPTCTEEGEMTYTCTICGASYTEPIDALGHDWEVEQTVIEDSEDRYEEMVGIKCTRCGLEYEEEIVVSTESSGVTAHSTLSWSDILTEDDLADLFESGAELDFKMTAAALSESDVPSADRTLAEDLIAAQWPDADYTASWLDISVLLDIIHSTGAEETREYSTTLNPVTITVTIPDELLNADGDTYAVIRIHSGEAEVLDTTDNGNGTLTFESDLFSSYVIVKTAESDSGNGGSGSGGSRRHSSNNSYTGSGVSGTGSIAYSIGTWTIDELGHWRYTDSNGRRYENEWGYIYNPYADISEGQPSASWFHFGYDGIMDTGWYIDTDGKMYYLNPSLDNTQGAMFTGWAFIDGKWYYFDASGALLRSTQTPDGYTVDETGARVER